VYKPGVGRVGQGPAPIHTFLGRDRELAQIGELLRGGAVRLITLVGPGGIGKTRLAAEVLRVFGKSDNGIRIHWVRLARLAQGAGGSEVEQEMAYSVIETDFSGRSSWDALVGALDPAGLEQGDRAVLVLDNCEHVLPGVRAVAAELLDAVDGLTVVATSRRPLGWVDEYLVGVRQLAKPHAVALFRQRAELTGCPIADTDDALVAEVCRHVDNHPLYIQLAAARLRRQPLSAILRGLGGGADDKRMRWSYDSAAGVEPRHRGVVDVIGWSYDLCGPEERLLFERLSVFAPGHDTDPVEDARNRVDVGADLEAIRIVCGDDESDPRDPAHSLAPDDIEGVLERLVDQSLVTVHITETAVRYYLLESLRLFARERLAERSRAGVDEPARMARRHLHYYRNTVGYAAAHWFGPAERQLLDWARAAWDNIVIALETSIATPGEAGAGVAICLGLISLRVPFLRGSIRDMRRWTQRCLDAQQASAGAGDELRIPAMAAITWLALRQGQTGQARRMLADCVAACLPGPATHDDWRAHPEVDIGLPAQLELAWGTELFMADRDVRAIVVLTRARDKFSAAGDGGGEMMSGMFAGLAAGLLGTASQAHRIARRCLDTATESGARWARSWAELSWAVALNRDGKPVAALDVLRSSLEHQLAVGDQWGAAWSVELRIWSLARRLTADDTNQDNAVEPATEIAYLAGGVARLRAGLGITIEAMGSFADESERSLALARRILGAEVFAAVQSRGARLRPEYREVQRFALGMLPLNAPPVVTVRWLELTPAEQQVAVLAAAGWTNTAIAGRRERSVKTIDVQLSAILRKLEIMSREDIIGFVPGEIIEQVRAETVRRAAADRS
jgi:predicted ATPase/DNA-binding CsgD family transcriptional regulator